MNKIRFYGCSDDLIYVVTRNEQEVEEVEEFGHYSTQLVAARFSVYESDNLNNQMDVYALYNGCWSFAASKNEGGFVPWLINVVHSQENAYSMELIIESDRPLMVNLVETDPV